MRNYFDSREKDFKVVIINDEDRGRVARLRQNDRGPDEKVSVETGDVSVPCLKCGEPLK